MEFFSTQNPTVLVMLVALSLALVRIIERLIDGFINKKRNNGKVSLSPPPRTGGCNGLTDHEHAALMRLDEMHSQRDKDGIPLWYVPRSMGVSLAEVARTLDKIAVRLRDVVKAQEIMNKRMDRWEDQTGRIEVPRRRV